jgi:two-component system OmpR family response regulator
VAHVLYAEDDPTVAALVEFRLAEDGHDVTIAPDGAAARTRLAEHHYDVVLLDVMMPGADGFALCRELAAREDRPWIVFVSARSTPADVRTGLDAGADEFVVKPFNARALADLVTELAQRQP